MRGPWMSLALSVLLAASTAPLATANGEEEGAYVPPRFQSGQFPGLAPLAGNGGLTVVEIQIAASGIVTGFTTVDDAPPFTEAIENVARLWTFHPASLDGRPVASRATVVGLYRAPTLLGAEPPPPERVGRPSGDVPIPTTTVTPAYPPNALFEGVVAVEVQVDAEGGVGNAQILSSSPGFQSVALEAAREFRFQPAKHEGRAVPAYALVLFGFPQPLTGPRPRGVGHFTLSTGTGEKRTTFSATLPMRK